MSELTRPTTSGGAWSLLRDYVWLEGQVVAQVEYPGPQMFAVDVDHLGLPRAMTGSAVAPGPDLRRQRPVRATRLVAIGVLAIGLSLASIACTDPPRPISAPTTTTTTRLTGTLLEKLDQPPYSFLHLRTSSGDIWVAVPVAYVDKEKPVTVLDGVALRNYSIGSTGRSLDVVYFGTLESR